MITVACLFDRWLIIFKIVFCKFIPRFLFQPDPIEGYEFYPIPIDIHLGIVKIPTKEILHDDAINNTEAIIVGTDGKEV